jgi:uncharacterized protein (DUF885 family)
MPKLLGLTLLCSAVLLATPIQASAQIAQGAKPTLKNPASSSTQLADQRFQALVEADWQATLRAQPELATSVGDHRYDDRLSDKSLLGRRIAQEYEKNIYALVFAYKYKALSKQEQLNFALFKDRAERAVAAHAHPGLEFLSLTALGGVHSDFAQLLLNMRFTNPRDYRNYIARLNAYPKQVDDEIAHLRRGMAAGWVTFADSLKRVPAQIDEQLPGDKALSLHPLFKPFTEYPATVALNERAALAEQGAQALQGYFAALRKLRAFVVSEYMAASPANGAMSAYPGGAAAYAFKVREHTTTDLTASQIHAIGLREVARLRAQMDALIVRTGFKGDFAAFTRFINTDPQFFYTSAADLLTGYRDIAKRVDPLLPYGIRPIPAHEGRDTPEYYTPGAADGSRSGYFNANVLALTRRPRWEMEALFLHEAVPGHHLQTARALELQGLPMFRRTAWYVAYGEGWALYAEGLGKPLGLYTDPYSEFGQLRMEMWRALRLVVDTGIHSMGWTRQRAIDTMVERSGVDVDDVAAEVDRYIVWPGQALGYMIGKLKIEELRDAAMAKLGSDFDLRAFHGVVLDAGALPLTVLEQRVTAWIEVQQNTRSPK